LRVDYFPYIFKLNKSIMFFNTDMNNVGRPRHVIDRARIDECRRSGLGWRDISNFLEVSFSTLRRWRIIHNYEVLIIT
jgi:hypothetical protein